jgi:hypothetical protein
MHKSVRNLKRPPQGSANKYLLASQTNRAVVPLHWTFFRTTRRAGRTDRMRRTASDRPASSTCSPKINRDRSILQRSLRANSQTHRPNASLNRPDAPSAQCRAPAKHRLNAHTQRSDVTVPASGRDPERFQIAPFATGRVRSHVTGCAARPISSTPRATPLGA